MTSERRGQLERQRQPARLLFHGDESNDDEWKQQRRRKVVRAEHGNDDPFERAESLRQRRRPSTDPTRLGVQID
jgi:hypothetical protein